MLRLDFFNPSKITPVETGDVHEKTKTNYYEKL
jgi:hypothetical protein